MNKLFFLTLVSLFHCCHAYEVKEISGSYQFGSDISRIEGCRNAIQSAKANALELYSAEFILSDKETRCYEKDQNLTGCSFTKILSSQYTSEIVSFKSDSQEIDDFGNYQICTVFGKAWIDSKKYDPNFYFSAYLNQTTFRDGENLIFEIITNSKMCINIFHATDFDKNVHLKKIFPNETIKSNLECFGKGKFFIPSKQQGKIWGFKYLQSSSRKFAEEYFLIVGSKKRIEWLNEYKDIHYLLKHFSKIKTGSRYYVSLPLLTQP